MREVEEIVYAQALSRRVSVGVLPAAASPHRCAKPQATTVDAKAALASFLFRLQPSRRWYPAGEAGGVS